MLTLFAIPKPFEGESDRIQRRALDSWLELDPIQIILIGNDPGVAEVAAAHGVEHLPDVAVNEFGTPLLDSAFRLAEANARYPTLAYVNADLILPGNFLAAVGAVRRATDRFMIVGECEEDGELRGSYWIDYFVFPRDTLGALPPFAVGRSSWDNWMIWRARKLRLDLVDITPDVRVIHQRHDYGHVPGGTGELWLGPESKRNDSHLRPGQLLSIDVATHRLQGGNVVKIRHALRHRVQTALFMHGWGVPIYRAVHWVYGLRKIPARLIAWQ